VTRLARNKDVIHLEKKMEHLSRLAKGFVALALVTMRTKDVRRSERAGIPSSRRVMLRSPHCKADSCEAEVLAVSLGIAEARKRRCSM
jgi:hypothetical protein